jgi:hypothetical protein
VGTGEVFRYSFADSINISGLTWQYRRPGWGHQEGPGRGFLFLLAKMSQDPVDDVLLLNATVRRSDDDFD